MRIVAFAPYGQQPVENNFLSMLTCFLKGKFPDTTQILCDGTLSFCQRDVLNASERDCVACQAEQTAFRKWGNAQEVKLSALLSAADFKDAAVCARDFNRLNLRFFEGVDLFEILNEDKLFQASQPQIQQKIIHSLALIIRAANQIVMNTRPDQVLIGAADDFISKGFAAVLRNRKIKYAALSFDPTVRKINITRSADQQIKQLDFLLTSLQNVRSDFHTWPSEAINYIQEVLEFLGLSDSQLTLPLIK